MSPRIPVSVSCVAVLAFAHTAGAQVIASDWNAGSGPWSLLENWDPAEVPGNAGDRTYLVQIGNRAAAAGAQVDLVSPAGIVAVSGLTLTGAGTSLSTNGFRLTVGGAAAVEGASLLTVKPAGTPVGLVAGTLLLTGQGTMDLFTAER